ncbi:MAG: hypothetical protein ACRD1L_04370 [Terriglobales bacterium]
MGSAPSPAATSCRDWRWSPAEKTTAHRAFDRAISRELDAIMREARERASRIAETSDLWELERWLSERRRQMDRTFDFRYSVLPLVFATLLRDGRLSEDELSGLAEEKLEAIRSWATC